MLKILLALWLACVGPAQHKCNNRNDRQTVTTASTDPTGDNGHPPPPPPPPPGG